MQAGRQHDVGSTTHTGRTIHRQWVCGWRTRRQSQTSQQRQEKGREGNTKTNPRQPLPRDPWPPPAPRPQPPHPPRQRRHLPPHQSKEAQAQRCYIKHCQQHNSTRGGDGTHLRPLRFRQQQRRRPGVRRRRLPPALPQWTPEESQRQPSHVEKTTRKRRDGRGRERGEW